MISVLDLAILGEWLVKLLKMPIENVDLSNSYDCGLLALVYVSSICDVVDPTTINYKQHNLRPHFLKC